MANRQNFGDKWKRLESLRLLAYENNFPIRKYKVIKSYLSLVYYMGSEKLKGGIIPITCSDRAINDLERDINLWVEKKILSENN